VTPVKTESADDSKLYRSISEVSEMVGVKPHVLRYWETQFSMLRPRKNRAGNRMYRPEEIQLLIQIRDLLYQRRFTIAGARRRLLDQRKEQPQVELGLDDSGKKLALEEVKSELRRLLDRLREHERPSRA